MEPGDPFRKPGRKPGAGDDPFARFFADFEREFEEMHRVFGEVFSQALQAAEKTKPGQPFVYGFTMRMGPDGRPRFESFGNAQHAQVTPEGAPVEAGAAPAREPVTDVLEGEKEVSVTVELPGVTKEDINLHVGPEKLTLRVDSGGRFGRYYKEVRLPARVVPQSAEATYKNGVLDVTLRRAESGDSGTRVPIK